MGGDDVAFSQKRHDLMSQNRTEHEGIKSPMTDAELLEFGRDLRTRWDGAWHIDGRPIGNVEMDALCTLQKHELQQLRDSGECCCDEGPWDDGRCRRGPGRCELFDEAKKILWRSENVD